MGVRSFDTYAERGHQYSRGNRHKACYALVRARVIDMFLVTVRSCMAWIGVVLGLLGLFQKICLRQSCVLK